MKRVGILTAGGDTPALNATITRANHPFNTDVHQRIRCLQTEAG